MILKNYMVFPPRGATQYTKATFATRVTNTKGAITRIMRLELQQGFFIPI